jgi:transporter family-2 protein
MNNLLVVAGIAVVAGVAVALQSQFMGAMDRAVGTATSVLITYGSGGVIALVIWLGRRGAVTSSRPIPWYAWFAGALGLVIVGGIGYATPRLGLSRTIIITVATQLLAAMVIDHFGLFSAQQRPFDLSRGLGFAVTLVGVWLIVKA